MTMKLRRAAHAFGCLLIMAAGALHAENLPRTVVIAVHDVVAYEDYAAIAAELRGQASLGQLALEEADRTTFLWQATTTLPPESLIDLLEASGHLRRSAGEAAVTDTRLELDWRGRP